MSFYYENKTDDLHASHVVHERKLQCGAHLHRHLELVLLEKGETVAFADTERCSLSAGDAFLVFPNVIHRYVSVAREKFYILIVNPDLMPAYAQLFLAQTPSSARVQGLANDPDVISLAAQLTALPRPRGNVADAIRQGLLTALFGKVLEKMQFSTAPAGNTALHAVLAYCNANYQKDLSLATLENELHLSKYYISHLFSDKLGIGFTAYVNSLRVSFACRYLQYGDQSITEIGSLVGFGTQRTFNRAFREQMGTTPLEYRRKREEEHK